MRYFLLLIVFALYSCNPKSDKKQENSHSPVSGDEINDGLELYANERFKEVRAERINENIFRITGKAQVFEAAFSWVVEDGHNELQKGHVMTDAGAPAFGNFSFDVTAFKQTPNTTLTLVLFEPSAKDGSRQYELAVPLK